MKVQKNEILEEIQKVLINKIFEYFFIFKKRWSLLNKLKLKNNKRIPIFRRIKKGNQIIWKWS